MVSFTVVHQKSALAVISLIGSITTPKVSELAFSGDKLLLPPCRASNWVLQSSTLLPPLAGVPPGSAAGR